MKYWRVLILGSFLTIACMHGGPVKAMSRAGHILQPAKQTWVCPLIPNGRTVVSREACFILHWPEPTL